MTRHIVLCAGEASGDQHGAKLARSIRLKHPHWKMSGVGGTHMEEEGVHLLCNLAKYGVTGIVEVIRHLPVIQRAFRQLKKLIQTEKPDLIILIDYPGFNLRMAKYAHQKGVRVLYYISPQIWAWKAQRIQHIKRYVDHMAVIFPFEKAYYEQVNMPVSFVGHPLPAQIQPYLDHPPHRIHYGLPPSSTLIALLPGSRVNEVKQHLPILFKTATHLYQQHPNLHFVIPIADSLSPDWVRTYWDQTQAPCTFIQSKALPIMACSDIVVVASGTASLECALLHKPMCIVYKTSRLTYAIATQVIRVRYLGLCNLLFKRMIVPELLQQDFNVTSLTLLLTQLLTQPHYSAKMRQSLTSLQSILSTHTMDQGLDEIVELILSS